MPEAIASPSFTPDPINSLTHSYDWFVGSTGYKATIKMAFTSAR